MLIRKLALIGMMAALAFTGCKQDGAGDSSGSASTAPASSDDKFAGFDGAAEIKALQGSWKVKDSAFGKELATWKIEGSTLTITKGDKTKTAEIEIAHPGQLAVVEKSGGGSSKSYFAFARSGADIYIGLGTAGIKKGDSYMVADNGVVVMKASACKYFKKKMFGGFENPTDVKCELKDEGGKQVFTYQMPDRFKKGEMTSKSVAVIGDVLLNQQMQGHKVEKAQ